MPYLLLKAAALAMAAGTAGTAGHATLASNGHQIQAQASHRVMYTVRSGDTLSRIAGYFCRDSSKYSALARANGISNPNIIYAGQHIWLACGGSGRSTARQSSSGSEPSGSSYAAGSANIPATSSTYSFAGLERLWTAAGGSWSTAAHAACIAEHESGGRAGAISPTNDYGLWQIHNGGYAMLSPYANAQRAVSMSGNGSNWGQWTTARYC